MNYTFKKRWGTSIWSVGFYDDKFEEWQPESDYKTSSEAANRVSFLNGNNSDRVAMNNELTSELQAAMNDIQDLYAKNKKLMETIADLTTTLELLKYVND